MRRVSATAGEMRVALMEGANLRVLVDFNQANSNIEYRGTAVWTTFGTVTADTWHLIQIDWRSSDHKCRFGADGSFTDWVAIYSDWTSGLDTFQLRWNNSTASNIGYLDYISETPYSATNIKTINGLAKANVKTINGVAIASVKTVNNLA